jgi:hypothetical protein
VVVTLRRGVTVRGWAVAVVKRARERVAGGRTIPGGTEEKPVKSGVLLAPTYLPRGSEPQGDLLPIRDGRFELPGCDPNQSVRVWFYDRGRHGACVDIPGRPDAEPVVRLSPCGSLRVRLVDRAGKPLAAPRGLLELVLRPGAAEDDPAAKGPLRVLVPMSALHGLGHGVLQHSAGTPAGEVRCYVIIPGGTYALRVAEGPRWPVKRIFTAPADGGEVNLGDVVVNP